MTRRDRTPQPAGFSRTARQLLLCLFLALMLGAGRALVADAVTVPDAGGPYDICEQENLLLSASATTDPGVTILLYEWDVNQDGFYETSGQDPTIPWSDLVSLGLGTHDVVLRVLDSTGARPTDTATLRIGAPAADAGGPYSIAEGDLLLLEGEGSTCGDRTISSYEWDLNADGVYDTSGAACFVMWSELRELGVNDDGTYPVELRITDSEGFTDEDTAELTITNTAPTAHAGGPYALFEGADLLLNGWISIDPSPADTLAFAWDLDDDGSYDDAEEAESTISWAILEMLGINDDGEYPIGVKVTDDDGGVGTASTTLTVENASPIADAGGPYSIPEGEGLQLNAKDNTSDPSSVDEAALSFSWDLDLDGDYDDATGSEPTLSWDDLNNVGITRQGTYGFALRVRDDDGGESYDDAMLTVGNTPPTADAGGPYTIDEGQPVTLDGSGSSDQGCDVDALALAWDLDGNNDYNDAMGKIVSVPWVMLSALGMDGDGTMYPVSLRVTDENGSVDIDASPLEIVNVAPSLTACPTDLTAYLSDPITGLTGCFSDPGPDTWWGTVDWGNGDTFPLSIDADTKTYAIPAYAYTSSPPGATDYAVTLTMEDDDGGIGTSGFSVTVIQDVTPPIVSFTDTPTKPTSSSSAYFAWEASDDFATSAEISYSYRLDAKPWTGWSGLTEATLRSLSEGAHSVEIRSRDRAENLSDPVCYEWSVDRTAPRVRILTPARDTAYLMNSFVLAAWEAFDLTLGDVGATVPNGEPIDTTQIGVFEFVVEATDDAGSTTRVTANYKVVPGIVPAPPAGIEASDAHVWTFLDRPSPAHSGSDGERAIEPIQYVFGEVIGVSFALQDANGCPLAEESLYVDVCRIVPSWGIEEYVFLTSLAVPYVPERGGYSCEIPTDTGNWTALTPGRYVLNLSTRATPIGGVRIEITAR
jgi:hypothetical protein